MRAGWLIVFMVFVTGCATVGRSGSDPAVYVVEAGDTVYSIAWRHGMDYRALARLNHIEPPYLIQPGLRLRVSSPQPRAALARADTGQRPPALARHVGRAQPRALAPHPMRTPAPLAGSPSSEQRRSTASETSQRETAVAVPRRPSSSWEAEPQAQAQARSRPAPTREPVAERSDQRQPTETTDSGRAAQPSGSSRPPQPAARTAGDIAWQWPVDGPVLSDFTAAAGNDGKSGINIGGEVGRAVTAAAPGRVVYSGSGLRGYGNLIIIKHDGSYLTAYGYNEELLVAEGDAVQGGQTIASMGMNSDREPALHFELRRDGQAVDPASFLPPR